MQNHLDLGIDVYMRGFFSKKKKREKTRRTTKWLFIFRHSKMSCFCFVEMKIKPIPCWIIVVMLIMFNFWLHSKLLAFLPIRYGSLCVYFSSATCGISRSLSEQRFSVLVFREPQPGHILQPWISRFWCFGYVSMWVFSHLRKICH